MTWSRVSRLILWHKNLIKNFIPNLNFLQQPCSHLQEVFLWKVKVKSLSRVRLFATPWTAASQAPLSMEFSRHEYWSGVPLPSPGDLTDSGIEPRSPALQADALSSKPLSLDLKKKKKSRNFCSFQLETKAYINPRWHSLLLPCSGSRIWISNEESLS